jgi:ribosomal protein S18 acetylase RimI-like enzyme
MTMLIRSLDATRDHARVMAFLHNAADYIRLERGADPSPEVAHEFFTDCPPGCDPAQSVRLGVFTHGQLVAITEMAMGYPDAQTAYLGFLLIAPQARGRRLGTYALHYLQSRARGMGATAICLGVLEANPRGRAFWQREGFQDTGISGNVTLGAKVQLAYRLKKLL